jgi:endonuclease-3
LTQYIETPRQLKLRTARIIRRLRKQFPNPKTALNFSSPLQLLIGTILSAQCTDKQVNIVTRDLFKKYKSVNDFANAKQSDLENDIRSTGFYKNKARNIIACCKSLLKDHGGKVPKTMEELVVLPGVGRKTANCVLGAAYHINEGVVVDTHVLRLSQRLRLSINETPEKIELDLMRSLGTAGRFAMHANQIARPVLLRRSVPLLKRWFLRFGMTSGD